MLKLKRLSKIANLGRFQFGSSYAKKMHEAWLKDPQSVHQDWNNYFKNEAPSVTPASNTEINSSEFNKLQDLAISAHLLIRYYKHRGH
jgi:2-oxoglutarate dehydrogenase complex dehydrogenase (E1) component-like enzyme